MTNPTTHHAEAILRAAGSSLRHYEPWTREAILVAVREAMEAERKEVVDWLQGRFQQQRAHPEDQAFARHIAIAIERGEHLPTPPRGE